MPAGPPRALPPSRLLGDGWEPHVDAVDGRLQYSIPVESGFMTYSFEFWITPADLAVLQADTYRRAALFVVLHAVLQRSTLPGRARTTPEEFRAVASQILFAPRAGLAAYLAAAGQEYNILFDVYIADELRRINRPTEH